MAKSFRRYILIFSLAFALASCGRGGYDRQLLEIERMIPQQADMEPAMADSAHKMIYEYAPARELSQADSALLTLLRAEADYKMYISNTDTVGLKKSADFFRRTGDRRRLMRTDYQIVEICAPEDKIEYGFLPALEGLDIAESLNDTEYLARFHSALSDSYLRRWSKKESLRHIKLAANHYKKAEMWPHFRYAKLCEAVRYLNLWEHQQAKTTLDSLIPIIPETDSAMLFSAYNARMIADYYLENYVDAKEDKRNAERFETPGCEHTQRFEAVLALVSGDNPEAQRILQQWEDTVHKGTQDEIQYLYTRYMYEKYSGNTEEALRLYEDYHSLSASYSIEYLNGGLNLLRAQYEAAKERDTAKRASRMRIAIVVVSLLGAGAIIGLLYYGRQVARRRRRELEEKMALISELSETLEEKKEQLNNSLKTQFKRINDLSVRYLNMKKGNKAEQTALLEQARNALAELERDDIMEECVRDFDIAHQGLATRIREALPDINSRPFHILIITLWGMTPKVVGGIFGLSDTALYTTRSRLRQRLIKSGNREMIEIADKLEL